MGALIARISMGRLIVKELVFDYGQEELVAEL